MDNRPVAIKLKYDEISAAGFVSGAHILGEDEYKAYVSLRAVSYLPNFNPKIESYMIPTIYYYGKFLRYNVIVMTRYEVNIDDKFRLSNGFTNYKTVLLIMARSVG